MKNRNRPYAYLSIDSLQNQFHKTEVNKQTLSSFFNIKFDINRSLRETHQNKRVSKIVLREDKSLLLKTSTPAFNKQSALKHGIKNIQVPNSVKKGPNTQKMLNSITKIIEKDHSVKRPNKDVLQNQRRNKSLGNELFLFQKKQDQDHEGNTQKYSKQLNERISRPIFQQMLKKCEKLKEIYKCQNQLVKYRDNHIGIRFHTEPLNQIDSEIEKPFQIPTPKKRLVKRFFQSKTDKSEQDICSHNKTLEIRKYNNQSVLKERLKNVMKKSRLRSEQKKLNEILQHQKWSSKVKARFDRCQNEQIKVGPWVEFEEGQDFLLK